MDINTYAESMTTPESPALSALNRETHASVARPNMLSGHLQGALLAMISQMARPKQVLEIGTYTGYSAICLARGLQPGGRLHTIDIDAALAPLAARYWEAAGVADRITAYTGRAAEIIPELPGPFDLVFIDADKKGYARYFDLVIEKVPSGGILLADNVLQTGDVLLPPDQQRSNTRAIHAFNEKIAADERVEQMLLPLRDGILMMRKI